MWEEKEHRKILLQHKEETKVKEPLTNHAQLNSTLIQEATSIKELVETDGEPSQSDAVSVDQALKHETKEQEQQEEHQEELISPPEQMDLVHEITVSTQQEPQQEAAQEPQTELTQQEPQETLQGKTLPEPQQEPQQDSHIDGKTEADEKEPNLQEAQNVLPPEPHKDSIIETNVEKETEKTTVPEEVALYALTQSTRSLKLRSMMISLDGLLDYDENDKNETTFEVICNYI